MTPQAHRIEPLPPTRPNPSKSEEYSWRCPGCATCTPRRDRLLAALVLLVFVLVFVAPVVLGWKP
jgi:hypothetical protein